MKKIKIEFSQESSLVRNLICELRSLLADHKVFEKIPEIGSAEYTQEAIAGIPDKHPLRQPARGLIHNLKVIIGGSNQDAYTIESFGELLAEAEIYLKAIERVYQKTLDDAQTNKHPVTCAIRSKNQFRHHLRNAPRARVLRRQRQRLS